MSIFQLTEELLFPPVHLADADGLLAMGGDLSPDRLLLAYRMGIFPWYNHRSPILWWSPDPRMVLLPQEIKVSKSMKQWLKQQPYRLTADVAFDRVMDHCAAVRRKGQRGTWILPEMKAAYLELHKLGYAHSIEVWQEDKLVGGLYGVQSGKVFSGESMFSLAANTSKLALIALCKQAEALDITLIDCQMYTEHLASMGAREIDRSAFTTYLPKWSEQQANAGSWQEWKINRP